MDITGLAGKILSSEFSRNLNIISALALLVCIACYVLQPELSLPRDIPKFCPVTQPYDHMVIYDQDWNYKTWSPEKLWSHRHFENNGVL